MLVVGASKALDLYTQAYPLSLAQRSNWFFIDFRSWWQLVVYILSERPDPPYNFEAPTEPTPKVSERWFGILDQ